MSTHFSLKRRQKFPQKLKSKKQSLPYSSHRKPGPKNKYFSYFLFISIYFLTFFVCGHDTEMNLSYSLFTKSQHDHQIQTQTQTPFCLDLQVPEIGWKGARSDIPRTQQEPTTQSVFSRHHPLNPPEHTQVCPWRRGEQFHKLSPMLSPARVQRCQTHSKTSALHALSLYVTGELQVSN